MTSRPIPLLIEGRIVAYGSEAQVLDLRDRLRARRIDATVPPACDGCGRRRGRGRWRPRYRRAVTMDGQPLLCARCYRRVAGDRLAIDHETEAERRGGAEPE